MLTKPSYPFGFTPSVDDLAACHATTDKSKKNLSKATNFLMEYMKLMPHYEATGYEKGGIPTPGTEDYEEFRQWDSEFFNERAPYGGIRKNLDPASDKLEDDMPDRYYPTGTAYSDRWDFNDRKPKFKDAAWDFLRTEGYISSELNVDVDGNGTVEAADGYAINSSFADRDPITFLHELSNDLLRSINESELSYQDYVTVLTAVIDGMNAYKTRNEIKGMLPELLQSKLDAVLYARLVYNALRKRDSRASTFGTPAFGQVHRQGNPFLGSGSGAMMKDYRYYDSFYTFDHIDDDFDDVSGTPLSVKGYKNGRLNQDVVIGDGVVPIWSESNGVNNRYSADSAARTADYFKSFKPTDYTNLMLGYNPYMLKTETDVFPSITDYQQYFDQARSYFNGMYVSNDYIEWQKSRGVTVDKNASPSFYQLAMDPTAPWNNNSALLDGTWWKSKIDIDGNGSITRLEDANGNGVLDDGEDANTDGLLTLGAEEKELGKISFYLTVLFNETKRRIFSQMTQMFGPHTQFMKDGYDTTHGNNSYVKNRYSFDDVNKDGVKNQYDADPSDEGVDMRDEQYNYNGEMDKTLIAIYDNYVKENFGDETSYIRQGFLSMFMLAQHSLTQWISAFSIGDMFKYSPKDQPRISAFRTFVNSNYAKYKDTIKGEISAGGIKAEMTAVATSISEITALPQDTDEEKAAKKEKIKALRGLINTAVANKDNKIRDLKLPTYAIYEVFSVLSRYLSMINGDDPDIGMDFSPLKSSLDAATATDGIIDKITNGSSFDELRKEAFYEDSDTVKYSASPRHWAWGGGDKGSSWDVTLGNTVANIGKGITTKGPFRYSKDPYTSTDILGMISAPTSQHHWYSIGQQINNYNYFMSGSQVRINFSYYSGHNYTGHDAAGDLAGFTAGADSSVINSDAGRAPIVSAYENLWQGHAVTYLMMQVQKDANMMAFYMMKNRLDKNRYRVKMSDYVQEKFRDDENEAKNLAISERRRKEANARVRRAAEAKANERKQEFKRMLASGGAQKNKKK